MTMNRHAKDFFDFIRSQGVAGLAIGFLLGGAVQKLISAFVTDILNPILGIVFGVTSGIQGAFLQIGPVKILWGDFANAFIDFLILSLVVYVFVKAIGNGKKPGA